MTPTKGMRMEAHRKGWTLVLASLGLFMAALDTLVVATALPVLRVDLGASLGDLEWTVNAYNLAFACFLLTGAALGDRFGRRRMFTLGLLGFTVASAGAALSPNAGALVGAGLLGITWGLVCGNTAGWASPEVIGTLVAGFALTGGFLAWERRAS